MRDRIIFLDVDGVLNCYNGTAGHTFEPECIKQFNNLMEQAHADVVLSSAWRYMILNQVMNITGFKYMMYTHGVRPFELIDHTDEDIDDDFGNRADLVLRWLGKYPDVKKYVVIDDLDLKFNEKKVTWVQTNPNFGLTEEDVKKVLELLNA